MSDTFGPGDLMKWEEMTAKIKEFESRISNLESVAHTPGLFPDAWDVKAMKRIREIEGKIETLWKWANDTGAATFASQSGRIRELEEKVESLTRTLDLFQEVIGIEVLVSVTGEVGDV